MIWFIVILFAVISGILLTGKGGFLIAGYNTSSEAERSRFNEKRLCRIMGGGMAVITLFMAADAFTGGGFSSTLGRWFGVLILAVVVVMIVLANTICKIKNPPRAVIINEESNRKWKRFSYIFTGIILLLVAVMLFTGSVKTTFEKEVLRIQVTYWPGTEIPYSKIKSASIAEDIHKGSRNNGLGSFQLSAGNWQNKDFGKYRLYAYANCKTYVVLDVDGETVVLNGKDEKATEQLLDEIRQHIE